jgi:putative transcriptional regulator
LRPTHHPCDETLLRLAAGTLGAGPRLVVATHVAGCTDCAARVRGFEAIGGALLEALPPTSVSRDGLARTLAKLDDGFIMRAAAHANPPPAPPGLGELPAPLRRYPIGPWRQIQSGFCISRVSIPEDLDANVILLKVDSGRSVPRHSHVGAEYTQVLSGAYSDALGHFGSGDFIEADEDIDHQPVVDAGGQCVCLAAVEGRLRLHSFVARLMQPFLGL